ncbi:MAG: hypothetical protein KFH98_14335, partial [Gemmatimonadetes bacterium]|nr:hypothetical protein [Gemmatimonadota bacterium]
LSRCAMRFVTPVRLTEGNEPRIALAVELALRDGVVLTVINVHFDWVRDDNFRFTQAREVADYLEGVSGPWILLGDLNDQSGSRTLALFQEHAQEAMKPSDGRFTFPSIDPVREIDFVFVAPRDAWTVDSVHVVDETIASDHRPVFAGVTYGNPESGGTRWDCSGT